MLSSRTLALAERDKLVAGDVSGDLLLQLMGGLFNLSSQMAVVASTPGLDQYARDQRDDQTYDVVLEYTTAKAAIDAAAQWVRDNLPVNASGRPDLLVWSGNDWGWRSFTTIQTAALVVLLDAITAAIAAP